MYIYHIKQNKNIIVKYDYSAFVNLKLPSKFQILYNIRRVANSTVALTRCTVTERLVLKYNTIYLNRILNR